MGSSKLKLNPTKTEFLFIGSSKQKAKFPDLFPITILENSTLPTKSAKNLGVLFDNSLGFREHISHVCRVCFYHIRDLKRVRKHISLDTAKILASALINSRLDYCNSLFYNLPQYEISRLQRVQNALARTISKSSRLCPSLPLLKKLHWLPVIFRIKYKICSLVFKSHFLQSPPYLSELLQPFESHFNSRSSALLNFRIPRVKTQWGNRSFSVAGPVLWNPLPAALKRADNFLSFKKLLKTHFFGEAFPS